MTQFFMVSTQVVSSLHTLTFWDSIPQFFSVIAIAMERFVCTYRNKTQEEWHDLRCSNSSGKSFELDLEFKIILSKYNL